MDISIKYVNDCLKDGKVDESTDDWQVLEGNDLDYVIAANHYVLTTCYLIFISVYLIRKA